MDHKGTQLHQEIIHTRETIDDKLSQVERRVQRIMHGARSTAIDVIDHGLIAGVQGARETRDRAVALVVWDCAWVPTGRPTIGTCEGERENARGVRVVVPRGNTPEGAIVADEEVMAHEQFRLYLGTHPDPAAHRAYE
jgi:hypothetical protein